MEFKLEETELNSYLKSILQIENWKQLYTMDPLELLRKIVIHQVTRVYFNNLQIASTPVARRKVPSESEIISINLRGEGGNSLHLNYFMGLLLKSVGYDVTMIAGSVAHMPRNHVINVVRFSPEESYLVDVACGHPSSCPVPLHDLPFTTGCCGGSTIEFRKVNNEEYAKVQIGGGFFHGARADGENENVLFTFDLRPVAFASFLPGMTEVFTDEEHSVFCRNLFLFRQYFCRKGDRQLILADGDEELKENEDEARLEFVLVFGKHILFGSDTRREVESFSTYEEMIPLVLKYFPKTEPSVLMRSIEYLNTVTSVELKIYN